MSISQDLLESIKQGRFEGDTISFLGEVINDDDVVKLAEALKFNPNIRKVNLFGQNVGDAGAIALANVSTIEELDVSTGLEGYDDYRNHIGPTGAAALAKSKLKRLNINGNPISDIGFAYFAKNETIVVLDASDCQITAKSTAEVIAQNTALRILNLEANPIEDEALKPLHLNHTLKQLNMAHCKLTSVGARFIPNNSSLLSLVLRGNRLGDTGAMPLALHPKLTYLDISDCGITDACLEGFAKNNKLKTFIARQNEITSNGVKTLSQNTILENVDLSDNEIDEKCIRELMAMKSLHNIKAINNKIGESAKKIIDDFFEASTIEYFDLMNNPVSGAALLIYTKKNKEADKSAPEKTELKSSGKSNQIDMN